MEDAKLVLQMQEGDLEAFEELMQRNQRELLRLAYLISGNHADSEDIVQETFVQAYVKRASIVKAGLPEITLDEYVSRPEEGDAEGTHYEKDGVSYYYSEMDCLFVPPSYELSEEEKAAEQAGTLNVGYGSDEVERSRYACVKWKADGVSYLLMGFEPALTESQMVEMAQEVMEE